MLSEKQNNFILYWESVRERESNFVRKLSGGVPMALIFGLPIILFLIIIYLFFPVWYMKISNISSGTLFVIVIGVIIAMIFFAYFRMQFKWEMNEQYYLELKKLRSRSEKVIDHI